MNFLEIMSRLMKVVAAVEGLGGVIGEVAKAAAALRRRLSLNDDVGTSYENVLLDASLDIRDQQGQVAILRRRQDVRFVMGEAGVIRDLVWGDGNPLAHYRAKGVHLLQVRREGSKQAVLLGLSGQAAKGERARIRTRRVIEGGFTQSSEYFEAFVERPTRRIAIRVIFPRTRPPKEARLVTVPAQQPPRRLAVKLSPDSRPYVSWSKRNPISYLTYSLRWSW